MITCRQKSQDQSYLPKLPTFLYSKRGIYYFRHAFPAHLQERLGRSEIRLSMRTQNRREAAEWALFLKKYLYQLLRDPQMLKFSEIKERLAVLLLKLVDSKGNSLEPYRLVLWGEHAPDEAPPIQMLPLEETIGSTSAHGLHLTTPTMLDLTKLLATNKSTQQFLYMALHSKETYRTNDGACTHPVPSAEQPFKPEWLFALLADRNRSFLTDGGYFTTEEFEENKALIGKGLLQMEQELNKQAKADEEGDFMASVKLKSTIEGSKPSRVAAEPADIHPSTESDLSISEAIEQFIDDKNTSNAWKSQTEPDVRNRLSFLIAILGDIPINSITRAKIQEFKRTLLKLPPNMSKDKLYKGKTVTQILEMRPSITLSVKSVNLCLEAVSGFLEWCFKELKITTNPAKGIANVKDDRKDVDLRDPFTFNELKKIFSHPKYIKWKSKDPQYYWIPLIALYSGMRLEEISQLQCADLKEAENGLWAFDLNTREADEHGFFKSLKSKSAVRVVPVHPTLIKAGLLEHLEKTVAAGKKRLFWQLNRTAKTPKYGKQPGKRFGDLVKAALGKTDKKSFHSLRHTFDDFFKQRGLGRVDIHFNHSKMATN